MLSLLSVVFVAMLFVVFGNLISSSYRESWGFAKCAVVLVVLSVSIAGVFLAGFITPALVMLATCGVAGRVACAA